MPPALSHARLVDSTAVVLSSLCLVHCLALPLLAATLPLLAPFVENEWAHGFFVAASAPLAVLLVRDTLTMPARPSIALQALLGIGLLIGALVVPALKAHEQWVTVIGGILLGSAHIRRWLQRAGTDRHL